MKLENIFIFALYVSGFVYIFFDYESFMGKSQDNIFNSITLFLILSIMLLNAVVMLGLHKRGVRILKKTYANGFFWLFQIAYLKFIAKYSLFLESRAFTRGNSLGDNFKLFLDDLFGGSPGVYHVFLGLNSFLLFVYALFVLRKIEGNNSDLRKEKTSEGIVD